MSIKWYRKINAYENVTAQYNELPPRAGTRLAQYPHFAASYSYDLHQTEHLVIFRANVRLRDLPRRQIAASVKRKNILAAKRCVFLDSNGTPGDFFSGGLPGYHTKSRYYSTL